MTVKDPRPVRRAREEPRWPRRRAEAAGAAAGASDAQGPAVAAKPARPLGRMALRAAVWTIGGLVAALAIVIGLLYGAPGVVGARLNGYLAEGEVAAPGLGAPAVIRRDDNGTPYIFAKTYRDAVFAQGFALGQDRLFQMEMLRRFARGELAAVAGPALLPADRRARVMGFRRLAEARLAALDGPSRAELEAFAAGLNAFITARPEDAPQELVLLGLERLRPWTALDVLSIVYAQSYYFSIPMLDGEIIAQGLLERFDGDKSKAEAFFPFVENPDAPGSGAARDAARAESARSYVDLELDLREPVFGGEPGAPQLEPEASGAGSNNWAFAGARTGGPAVFANDPHLDIRSLPGPWHPVGLFTEDGIRAVGANIGLPGIVVGRTAETAFGVTIGYMDNLDLYVEEIDPARPGYYREAGEWVRAERLEEPIEVLRDGVLETEQLIVYLTPRGPILPNDALVGAPGKALSVRWSLAAPEMATRPYYRFEPLLRAKSAAAAVAAMERLSEAALNFVAGDRQGRIGRRSTGFLPDRVGVDGFTPTPAAAAEAAWAGYLSGAALPGELDPARGWTGSANHAVAPADFGRPFSDIASPGYRYERMRSLFNPPGRLDARLAAQAQRDLVNLHAERIVPLILTALDTEPEPEPSAVIAAEILRGWDRRDDGEAAAPLIFQQILREAATQLYLPSLGPVLAERMLKRREFWQQRFEKAMLAGEGALLTEAGFEGKYGRDVLLRRATLAAMTRLEKLLGPDPRRWRWSDALQVRFEGPLPAPAAWEGVAAPLGLRYVRISGSSETLDRAHTAFFRPDPDSPLEAVDSAASLRLVVDLADQEKVAATLAGGVTGRTMHPHLDDQIAVWRRPDATNYWWFSEEKIKERAVATLTLTPAK